MAFINYTVILYLLPQNDRGKALKAMEATWNNMEKKEKLMWIKKAAEDQKRYEVGNLYYLFLLWLVCNPSV